MRGRKEWAAALVRAARRKGLHALAISDHHDFANFPLVKAAAAAEALDDGEPVPERERLVVFPALELTLEVPCQAILILDANFSEDRLRDVLTVLQIERVGDTKAKLPQAQVIPGTADINALHDVLDKHTFLKGHYILLPHVTPDGHKTLLKNGFHTKYATMRSVGGYLDGPTSVLNKPVHVGRAAILNGKDPAWGSRRIAVFATSDTREHDFARLGAGASWVKWAEPTAEAIRQACLAQESRISDVEPSLPTTWISRVVVSQSKFLGRLDLALNPQYTALIGGRGTGKSTVLDYVRWTLCDQPTSLADDDEVANPRIRQARLIEATLAPVRGHVEVHCMINEIPHVVRRYSVEGGVQLKVGDGKFAPVREADVQNLLPVHAYSQKQLSSVAIRNDELERFVTSPVRSELDEIERGINDTSDRLRENYGSLQRYRSLSAEIDRSELKIASLGDQAQAMRNSIEGLDDSDRRILDDKATYDDVRAAARAWRERLDTAREALGEAASTLSEAQGAVLLPDNVPEAVASSLALLQLAVQNSLTAAEVSVRQAETAIDSTLIADGAVTSGRRAVDAKLEEFNATYAAVKAKASAQEARLAQLGVIEAQQKEARELLESQKRDHEALGDPAVKHSDLRRELLEARARRTAALVAQCESLSQASDGLILASLATGRGFAGVADRFKAMIAGSRVRANKVEQFFNELAKDDDPLVTWELVLGELQWLMQCEPDADVRSQDTPNLSRLRFEVPDQKRIIRFMTPDGWLDLSLASIADQPQFSYRAKEGEYIPFGAASAGQQASALLTVLLSQTGMPLIIDQPEEDLDSETVELIVRKIWVAKTRRQLIFASHNANLVVNGDADLVAVCAYADGAEQSAGRIKRQGAIDVDKVRKEITAVMEGGERAFRLRKEKYGF